MTALKHLGGSIFFVIIECTQFASVGSENNPIHIISYPIVKLISDSNKNVLHPAEAVGRLESEKAAIHAEYEQVGIFIIKKIVLSPYFSNQSPKTLSKCSPNEPIVQERIAYQKLLKDFNRMEAATENLQDEVDLFAHW